MAKPQLIAKTLGARGKAAKEVESDLFSALPAQAPR